MIEDKIAELRKLIEEAVKLAADIIQEILIEGTGFEEIVGKLSEQFGEYEKVNFENEEPERTPYLMPAAPEVFPPARRWKKNRAFFRPKNNAGNECQRKRGVYHELFQGSGRPSPFGAYA